MICIVLQDNDMLSSGNQYVIRMCCVCFLFALHKLWMLVISTGHSRSTMKENADIVWLFLVGSYEPVADCCGYRWT